MIKVIANRNRILPYIDFAGFTFLEIMIAVVVLAIAIVGAVATFTHSMFLSERAQNLTLATAHAQYTLEQIKKTDIAVIPGFPWTTWAENENLNTLPQEVIRVSTAGGDPLNVTVNVEWTDNRGLQRLSFSTRVTQ